MSLKIQTEDGYIFRKTEIVLYLSDCLRHQRPAVIDLNLEGNCAESMGLYALLDDFCQRTGFPKYMVTIITGNMLESHSNYNIIKDPDYWFEIPKIQQWALDNRFDLNSTPNKHFGSFVGQSRWPRLWISAWLWKNHRPRTLMTFHSGLRSNYRTSTADGVYDWLGLDQLNQYDCDIMPDVAHFLQQCPMTIEQDILAVKNTNIIFDQPTYYPLQHPANLNIIGYYEDIFVDIINETSVTGRAFFATEKLWRCILAKRPFIAMANQDYLHNLQQLGFKTFEPWWREYYDFLSNQDRVKAIQTVISEIAQWPKHQLADTLEQMKSTLDHNFERFLQLTTRDLLEVANV